MIKKIISVLTILDINKTELSKAYFSSNRDLDLDTRYNTYNFASTLVSDARFDKDVMSGKKDLETYIKTAEIKVNGESLSPNTIVLARKIALQALNKTNQILQEDPEYFENTFANKFEDVFNYLIIDDFFDQKFIKENLSL